MSQKYYNNMRFWLILTHKIIVCDMISCYLTLLSYFVVLLCYLTLLSYFVILLCYLTLGIAGLTSRLLIDLIKFHSLVYSFTY